VGTASEDPAAPSPVATAEKGAEEQKARIMAMAAAVNASSGNSLLADLARERMARTGGRPRAVPARAAVREMVVYSQNMWFREDVALTARMDCVGKFIAERRPDVVCLQEVTPNIHTLLRSQPWWGEYAASREWPPLLSYYVLLLCRRSVPMAGGFSSRPFENSSQGREIVRATLDVGGGDRLTVSTSHLESFTGRDSNGAAERVQQLAWSLEELERDGGRGDLLLAGDLNWSDKEEGKMRLRDGWVDAWTELKPGDPGYTYDAKENPMLLGGLRKRFDRLLFRGGCFRVAGAELVLKGAIPGVTMLKKLKKGDTRFPVLPSDHFGLVVTLVRD